MRPFEPVKAAFAAVLSVAALTTSASAGDLAVELAAPPTATAKYFRRLRRTPPRRQPLQSFPISLFNPITSYAGRTW